ARTLKPHPRKTTTAVNSEYMKPSIRTKEAQPSSIIKRQSGFGKARYKSLLKNNNQRAALFTLAHQFREDQMIRHGETCH
ncbi:IS5/IS1182 family transposase, partial [Escherichia coli]|nr:IS5/IS1182 family transposase [Escherichia coli]